MNYFGKSLSPIARGVYLYNDFLPAASQNLIMTKTMQIWSQVQRQDNKQEDGQIDQMDVIYLMNSDQDLVGRRWISENQQDFTFNGNKNIPNFVKSTIFPPLFYLLGQSSEIPKAKRGLKVLRATEWNVNISVNLSDPESREIREFSCGSLRSDQTALMIYSLGSALLFHVPDQSDSALPCFIPHNSLVMVTKKAFLPNEKFVLPLFRQAVNSPQNSSAGDVTKVIFSFKLN